MRASVVRRDGAGGVAVVLGADGLAVAWAGGLGGGRGSAGGGGRLDDAFIAWPSARLVVATPLAVARMCTPPHLPARKQDTLLPSWGVRPPGEGGMLACYGNEERI